jgi:predicted dehydrogenase
MASQSRPNRRQLIQSAAGIAAFTIIPANVLGRQPATAPSNKLNIAAIGLGAQGSGLIQRFISENIVALCEVDQARLASAAKTFPSAKTYSDFRKLFDAEKSIDAVVIATPDHLHAPITMAALKLGKHVYCEKPLTHSVGEARKIAQAARDAKVATQMGNNLQALEKAYRVREMLIAGVIGNVHKIHAWSNRKPDICPRGQARPKDTPPVPATLDWDLWLGPAPQRPYHPAYCPWAWRGWWDFGTGVLGDIGCHQLSTAFKALKLGSPTSVEACSTNWQRPKEVSEESAPLASMVRYEFPAVEARPALSIIWYDGGMRPPRPEILEPAKKFGVGDGILYVGDKGMILDYDLIPDARAKEYKHATTLPRSPGHWEEWLRACKGAGPAPGADFVDHAAHLSEVVLLGNIAIRMNQKLLWDSQAMKFTHCPDADQFVDPPYRTGWTL